MTADIALVLGILLGAVYFFVTGWLRMDLVALLVLVTLAITGLVTPAEALAGFGNPAVVTIWAMFIISGALILTGVSETLGDRILRIAGTGEVPVLIATMLTAGVMSAFMSNVGVAAIMLPVVVDLSRRTGRPPSRLLLPLAMAALLGGLTTMIGTPPNILVADAVRAQGLEPFGLLDFTPIGLPILLAGIAFAALIGRHLLPDRDPFGELDRASHDPVSNFALGERLFTVRIPRDWPLAGRTLGESRLGSILRMTAVAIVRKRRAMPAPGPNTVLLGGDRLLVLARPDFVEEVKRAPAEHGTENVDILSGLRQLRIEPYRSGGTTELESSDVGLAKIVLSPETTIEGRTLRELEFRDRYGLTVLAIWRAGRAFRTGLADMALRFGDAILVQGDRDRLRLLARDPDFIVASEDTHRSPRRERAPVALGILAALLLPVILGWLPVAIAAVTAAALMVLARCLTMEDAYRFIQWPGVFLIAGLLPLGVAMERTGAAAFLAGGLIGPVANFGPTAALAAIFVITACASFVIPPPAAVVLMVPVAVSTAADLGASPLPFLMTLAMAAAPLASPISHPANTLVQGPGGYRFADFVRFGLPVTVLALLIVLALVPALWPFHQ